MRIAENAEMLELETTLANGPGVINPLLIWDEDSLILFDAGLPNMAEAFKAAAAKAGAPFDRLSGIFITHSDIDHIGSAAQLRNSSLREVTLYAHINEKPYIENEIPPLRLTQLEASAEKAEGAARERILEMAEAFKRSYKLFKTEVDSILEDGETLPLCGGITCIYTPGHTPGHMCYYIKRLKMLVAGDLLQIEQGKLIKCPDFTITDIEAYEESLRKVSDFDIESVVCYHGGFYKGCITRDFE